MGKLSIGMRASVFLTVAALLLSGCSAKPPTNISEPLIANTQAPLQTPPATLQTVDGLGVNANIHNWDNGELKPAIDMIAEMGSLTWRVIVDKADWEPVKEGADPSVFNWAYYEKIYTRGKMADLFNTIAYINSKPGQKVSINVMGGVPEWMGGTEIKPEFEDYWVRMIASMVYFARENRKLDVTLLSPLNEIDWDGIEGPKVGPEQYVRLMHKLSDALDGLGLADIKFVGPDTASADKAVDEYLPAIVKDTVVMDRMVYFGIHSYDGTSAGATDALAAVGAQHKNVWVTEFSGPCPGCDSGAPNPDNWDSAQESAGQAIRLLHEGMSGLQIYDAWDGYYEHHDSIGYWGLLAYDASTRSYAPRKSYFVMRQLFEFVLPSSNHVDCTSSLDDVQVACFLDPKTSRLVVFGSNHGDQDFSVEVSIPQTDMSAELTAYHTDAKTNMEPGRQVSLVKGSATFEVGPRSVFTLTSQPGS